MANMYSAPTVKFKPFTFEEMLKPALMATEAHNKLEEEYDTLATLTADLENKLTNNPKDEELRKTYNTYKEALNKASEELYKGGLSPQSKRAFSQLRNEYASKINPINEAYKKYVEQQDVINKLALTNPEIIVTGAGDSISDYMNGNTPELSSVNLDKLTAQALAGAKADSERTRRKSKWRPVAGGRFMEQDTIVGLSDEEFDTAIAELNEYNKGNIGSLSENAQAIQNIIGSVIGSSNYGLLQGTDQQRAYDAIINGIRSGYAYDVKTNTQSDPMFAYRLKQKEEEAKRREAIEKARAERQAAIDNIGSAEFHTGINQDKKDEFKEKFFDEYNSYSEFFNPETGKLLTKEEYLNRIKNTPNPLREYYSKRLEELKALDAPYSFIQQLDNSANPGNHVNMVEHSLRYDEFKQNMIESGLDPNTTNLNDINQDLEGDGFAINRYEIIPSTDVTPELEQRFRASLNNQDTVKQIIGVTTDSNGNYVYDTEDIDFEDLLNSEDKLNILSTNYALGKYSIKLIDEDNEVVDIILPENVFHRVEDIENIKKYDDLLKRAENNEVYTTIQNEDGTYTTGYFTVDPRDIIVTDDGIPGTLEDYKNYNKLKQYEILKGSLNVLKQQGVN